LKKVNISIIIPVFNVEKYVETCLDSIFNQKFSGSIEVITVDDFSTDNSFKILNEYKLKFPELIILRHDSNKRLASARSTGMKVAKGDYILHVDSDDKLLPDTIENLYDKCLKTDADVVVFNYISENQFGKKVEFNKIKKEIFTTDKYEVQSYFFGACWNKIVKRSITKKMVYSYSEAPKSTEDLIYCSEILLRSKTICLYPELIYCYSANNTNSITSLSKANDYLRNQQIISRNLKKIFNKYNPQIEFKNNLLLYFEKWIFRSICQVHFWNKNELIVTKKLLENIFSTGILEDKRIKKIKKSVNNKLVCLYYITNYFSLRYALGIIFKSLMK